MSTKVASTVKGADIEPGKVYKLGGRWYRVLALSTKLESGNLLFKVIAHGKDPRLADLPTYRNYMRIKYVFADDDIPTREQPPVFWDWVTRMIEKGF